MNRWRAKPAALFVLLMVGVLRPRCRYRRDPSALLEERRVVPLIGSPARHQAYAHADER